MTVEGMDEVSRLHPIQEGFLEEHGLQCGFCTPGFLCTIDELLEYSPEPTGRRNHGRAERPDLPLHRIPTHPGRDAVDATKHQKAR